MSMRPQSTCILVELRIYSNANVDLPRMINRLMTFCQSRLILRYYVKSLMAEGR